MIRHQNSADHFVDQIDLDALYEGLGWEPLRTQGQEDIGHCPFPENHKNGDQTGKFAINREKRVANCVPGETWVTTIDGPRTAKSLSGSTSKILTGGGVYRNAKWDSFGKQKIWEIELETGEKLYATKDHRWRVSRIKGERWSSDRRSWVLTDGLLNRRIPVQHAASFKYDNDDFKAGCLHGFVYGDGTLEQDGLRTHVDGFGDEDREIIRDLAPIFGEYVTKYDRTFTRGRQCPGKAKELPSGSSSSSYLRGFIAGLLAADGHVKANASPVIHQAKYEHLVTIKRLAAGAGLPSSSIVMERKYNPWTGEYAPLWALCLVRAGFFNDKDLDKRLFLKPSHYRNAQQWHQTRRNTHTTKVVNIQETNRVEEVFCCVEPITQTMVVEGYLTGQCWVCGGMSLPELVARIRNLSPTDAVEWLRQYAKPQERSSQQFYAEIDKLLQQEQKQEPVLPYFNSQVLHNWPECNDDWLQKRHISKEVAEYFHLGCDYAHRREGRWGPAIILPHFWEDRLVGWQERWLDDRKPKYTNTSRFPRDNTIWGYDFCKQQKEIPVLVESVPTALYLISEGYPSMATFGAAITQKQLWLLRVFYRGLIVAPDNDVAGGKWLEKVNSLRTYIPLLQVPFVEGFGADLGDLEPEKLATHMGTVSYFTPFI